MELNIFRFIQMLDEFKIFYKLDKHRENMIVVEIAVPGERWEVEFSQDGDVDVEIFKSTGKVYNEAKLAELFKGFTD